MYSPLLQINLKKGERERDKKKADRPTKHSFINKWSVHFLLTYIPAQWDG
jgi:hypothetical protein